MFYGSAHCAVDTPELRAVMAAHLTDCRFDARLAAAASALRGDEHGTPALEGIRRGVRNRSGRGAGRVEGICYLLRARTACT